MPSVKKSGSLNLLDPSRPRRPVTGVLYFFLLNLYSSVTSVKELLNEMKDVMDVETKTINTCVRRTCT